MVKSFLSSRLRRIPAPYKYAGSFLLGAVIFGVIGWYIPSPLTAKIYEGVVLRQSSGNYQFIRPLLTCDIASQEVFTDLYPLKNAITSIIQSSKGSGGVTDVSVYYRDRDAHWFSINGETTYAPASLLKVFVMMAYYKEAEVKDEPSVLQHSLVFKASTNPAEEVPGEVIPHLTNGQTYTVNQLIQQMIVYSDNDALHTLVDNMGADTFEKQKLIFSDLKVSSPLAQSQEITDYMQVNDYATVFRVLSGSTYLSTNYSEAALKLLSEAHYNEALAAGIPSGTVIAHKFGISPGVDTTGPQLHDCGIIYYPHHSYILCVMTRGSNYEALKEVIRKISAETYAEISKKFPS
jgi:beta-lactamase class A